MPSPGPAELRARLASVEADADEVSKSPVIQEQIGVDRNGDISLKTLPTSASPLKDGWHRRPQCC